VVPFHPERRVRHPPWVRVATIRGALGDDKQRPISESRCPQDVGHFRSVLRARRLCLARASLLLIGESLDGEGTPHGGSREPLIPCPADACRSYAHQGVGSQAIRSDSMNRVLYGYPTVHTPMRGGYSPPPIPPPPRCSSVLASERRPGAHRRQAGGAVRRYVARCRRRQPYASRPARTGRRGTTKGRVPGRRSRALGRLRAARSITATPLTGLPLRPGRAHSAPDGRAIGKAPPETAHHTRGDRHG
jgi:hypothetical protein